MHTPAPHEIDAVAEEASQDVRDLCGIWRRQGPAALDTAVRSSPNLAFAVLDGRRAGAGAVRLLAMRPSRDVLLEFAQASNGERRVIVYGLDACRGCILLTNPTLAPVEASGGRGAMEGIGDTPSGAFAFELARRFNVGVSPSLISVPSDLHWLPPDFAPHHQADPVDHGPPLLIALDAAASMLAGRLNYQKGLDVIVQQQNRCGLPERDSDLFGIYSVHSQGGSDLDMGHEFRRKQTGGEWTWDDELADFEKFARSQAEPRCRSLIARFRGGAFAEIQNH